MTVYDRLQEFNNILYYLTLDYTRLKNRLGSRNDIQIISRISESNRRLYFKAIFTFIEAVVEQNKKLLFQMHDEKKIKFDEKTYNELEEKKGFLKLKKKIKLIFITSGKIFGSPLEKEFIKNKNWNNLIDSIPIRNRITHPKSLGDCFILSHELDLVESGIDWFQKMHNKFVKLINEHKRLNKW